MTEQPTCGDCKHHFAKPGALHGECRFGPPTHAQLGTTVMLGAYQLTANDLPACGQFVRASDAGSPQGRAAKRGRPNPHAPEPA